MNMWEGESLDFNKEWGIRHVHMPMGIIQWERKTDSIREKIMEQGENEWVFMHE